MKLKIPNGVQRLHPLKLKQRAQWRFFQAAFRLAWRFP
jgi:hypothetical protein